MATQLSAITMVGTTGQGYNDGLRFIQFYYGLPLAMVILSRHVRAVLLPRARLHRVRVARAAVRCEDALADEPFCFCISRGMSCGAIISAPAVVMSIILGLDVTATALLIGLPAVVYTIFGGVQAVTWTDVKIMTLIIGGLVATVVALVARAARSDRPRRRAVSRGRDRTPGGARLAMESERDLLVLVGPDRRAVPDAVVLRLRSEPGAALPDREVAQRGAALAVDERVLEDPAAGARAAGRHPGLRVLPLYAAADAVRPRAGSAACARARRAAEYLALEQTLSRGRGRAARRRRAVRRGRRRAMRRRSRSRKSAFQTWEQEVRAVRQKTLDAGARRGRRPHLHRRQLRLPDLHPHAAADRLHRSDDGRRSFWPPPTRSRRS